MFDGDGLSPPLIVDPVKMANAHTAFNTTTALGLHLPAVAASRLVGWRTD